MHSTDSVCLYTRALTFRGLSVCLSVCVRVWVLFTTVSPTKRPNRSPIEMSFGGQTWVGPRNYWIRWLYVFSVILWILPPVFTASFLHPDPPLSPLGCEPLKSFLKSILVRSAFVLLYNMVITTTSEPTFLPWSYLSYY